MLEIAEATCEGWFVHIPAFLFLHRQTRDLKCVIVIVNLMSHMQVNRQCHQVSLGFAMIHCQTFDSYHLDYSLDYLALYL